MAEPEVWLRGALPDVPALLQPVAHCLLQCREEVAATLPSLTPEQIWARPGGAAAVGYHARHAVGSLDRLFTYARGEALTRSQMTDLASQGRAELSPDIAQRLVAMFDAAVVTAIAQLKLTPESKLTDVREVGRAKLPSTVIGLLFHAAEHTQRHVGQLATTAKIVRGDSA